MWHRAGLVDVVDHRGERRRLARAGRTGDEHEPAGPLREVLAHLRQVQLLHRRDAQRDDAEDGTHRVALLEHVGAEARQARDAVREVELELGLEAPALLLGEHGEDHLLRVLGRQRACSPRTG